VLVQKKKKKKENKRKNHSREDVGSAIHPSSVLVQKKRKKKKTKEKIIREKMSAVQFTPHLCWYSMVYVCIVVYAYSSMSVCFMCMCVYTVQYTPHLCWYSILYVCICMCT